MQSAVSFEYRGQTLRGMLHVPDNGSGPFPTALIFHGFTGNKVDAHRIHVNCSRMLETLGIASVRYDFLGSGESDGSFSEMILSSEADQAAAIYRGIASDARFDSERLYLIGHSMGGVVASFLSGREADRADVNPPKRVVLMAPAGNMTDIAGQIKREAPAVDSPESVYDYQGYPIGSAFLSELPGFMNDLPGFCSRYKGEVLVVHGAADEAVPPSVGKNVASLFSGRAEYIEIPGADHCFSSMEHERLLFETIGRFLT